MQCEIACNVDAVLSGVRDYLERVTREAHAKDPLVRQRVDRVGCNIVEMMGHCMASIFAFFPSGVLQISTCSEIDKLGNLAHSLP